MKTAVCRVIEGSATFDIEEKTVGKIPLKFAHPESMFAIELSDDEELKSLDFNGIPQSLSYRSGVGENGELVNIRTGVYLFRGLAVAIVDKSAEEVMADIARVQELEEVAQQNGIPGENAGVGQAEDQSGEGSHAGPVPGDEEA